jgi:hypothetical protein
MQLKTDGNHEYRLDQLRRVMQQADENTKAGAFDFSTASPSKCSETSIRRSITPI